MRASRGTATFFPLAASYRFCGDRGAGREQVELGSGLRHEQEGRESRGKKGGRELLEKRRGTSASLYLARGRAGRCGATGVTGQGVVHRYAVKPGSLVILRLQLLLCN